MKHNYLYLKCTIIFLVFSALLTVCGTVAGQESCPPVGLPIVEDFNTTDSLPTCWERDENFDDAAMKAHIVGSPVYSGIGALMISSGPDNDLVHQAFVMGRRLTTSPTGIKMKMKVRANHAGAVLMIGACESNSFFVMGYGFQAVDTLIVPVAQTWIDYEVDFAGYSGSGDRLAFRMMQAMQGGQTGNEIYIDEMIVERCAVSNLTLSHRSSDEMTLHWQSFGQGTATLTVTPVSGGVALTFDSVTSPFRITGLTPSTTYTLTLTPQCDGEVADGIPQSIPGTTLPGPHEGLIYCEGFETTGMPTAWIGAGSSSVSSTRSYSGYSSLYLYGGAGYATMPQIAFNGGALVPIGNLMLEMMIYQQGSGSMLEVGLTNYPEEVSTIVPIDTIVPAMANVWGTATIKLEPGNDTGRYIVLRVIGSGSMYIDEVRVGRCLLTGVGLAGKTATSVTLEWDTPISGGNVTIEPITGGGNTLTLTPEDCTASNGKQRYTITGLAAGSSHSYYVYGSCDTNHCGAATVAVTTYAQDYSLPYCNDFEGSGTLPTDWQNVSTYNNCPQLVSGTSHSGNRSLKLSAAGGVNSSHSMVMLPPIQTGNATNVTLSFAAYTQYTGCTIEVGTIDEGGNASTFVSAGSINPTQLWERYSLNIGSTGGQRVAIRFYHNGYGTREAWVDDLEMSLAGVGGIHSYGERATGATLEWSTTCDTVDIQIRRNGSIWTQTFADTTSPLVLDSLEEGSIYSYYVRSRQGGITGCWMYGGEFTTNSDALRADYCHPTTITVGTGYWTLPFLEEDSYTGLRVSLEAMGSGTVRIGLMSDPSDAASFTQIASTTINGNDWSRLVATLDGHEADGHYIALQCTYSAQVQRLRIARSETVSTAVGAVGATQATITWTTAGSPDSIQLTVFQGISPILDTTLPPSATSLTITGLDIGSTYTYSLTAIDTASQRSCPNLSGNFTTLSSDIADGWCEDFDNISYGGLPTGWTVVEGNGSDPAVYYNTSSNRLRLTSNSQTSATIAMPTALAAVNSLQLRAEILATGSAAGQSMLVAGVMTDAADILSFIATDTVWPTSTKNVYILDLSSYSGTGRTIALRHVSPNGGCTLYIDKTGLSQQQIGEVTADRLTDHSVRLRWSGSTTVHIVGTSVDTVVSGHEAAIDGLSAGTSYSFDLFAVGADSMSVCQYVNISCHTLDEPMSVPLCAGLDDYNSDNQLPYGWTRPYGNYPVAYTGTRYQGTRSLRFYTYGMERTMAVSPMLEATGSGTFYLSFYLYNTYSSATMEVGLMSDPADTSTFTPLQSYGTTGGWSRCEVAVTVDTSAATYIAFRHTSTGYSSTTAYIDQLMMLPCPMPTAYTTNPRTHSTDVYWSYPNGEADSVIIEWEGNSVHVGTSPYTITGLNSSTSYTIYVRPLCGTDINCHRLTLTQTTLPEPIALPQCQYFSGYYLPSGWTTWTDSGSSSLSYYTPDQSRALRLSAVAGGSVAVLLPEFNTDGCTSLDSIRLSFNLSSEGQLPAGSTVQLGVAADRDASSSFTPLQNIPTATIGPDHWQTFVIALQAVQLDGGFLALRLKAPANSSATLLVDNFCTDYCFILSVSLDTVTPTSATFSWQGRGADSLHVSWSGGSVTVGESPFTVTGLTPNAYYTFHFSGDCACGNTYAYAGYISTRLPAEPMAMPVCYTLDGYAAGSFPDQWRRTGGNSTAYPRVVQSADGNRNIDLYTDTWNPLTMALEPLPDQRASVVVSLRIRCSDADAADTGVLALGTMTNPEDPATFSHLQWLVLDATDTWQNLHIALPQPSSRYVALRFTPSYSYHLYVDDIGVSACAVAHVADSADNIVVATIPDSAAYLLTATNILSQTTIVIGQYSNTPLHPRTSLPLSDDSAYILTATALCGGDTLSCRPESVTVGLRHSLPWCEDFSATTLQPEGWNVVRRSGPVYPRIDASRYHMQPDTAGDIVQLPLLPTGHSLGGLHVKLTLTLAAIGDTTTRLDLGYIHGDTFTTLSTLANTSLTETHHITLPPSSATRLALRGRSTDGRRDLLLSNLQITTYPEPPTFTMPQTGYRQQHIYWNNTADNATYGIEYGPSGFTPGTGTTLQSDSCHAVLAPLTPSTNYQFYLVDTAGNLFCHPHTFRSLDPPAGIPWCSDATVSLASGQTFILPEDTVPLAGLTLLLTWQTSPGGRLVVGALTDRSNLLSFSPIDTLLPPSAGGWQRSAVSLAPYADTGHFIALRFDGAVGSIVQTTLQSIAQPTFRVLSSSEIEVTGGDSANYCLRVVPTGSAQNSGTIHHVTTSPYIISGLDMFTWYDIYTLDSTAGATCAPPVTLRTHLDIAPPYCAVEGSDGWYTSGTFHIMPRAVIDTMINIYCTFHSSGSLTLGVQSTLTDTSTFVPLASFQGSTLEQHLVHLSDYASLVGNRHYLAFRYGSGDAELQQVYLHTCPVPTATLDEFNVVRFDQTDTTPDYWIEYDGNVVHADTTPFYIRQLDQNTLYRFSIQCDSATATCIPPIPVLTGVQITAPYCANLSGHRFTIDPLPAGWFTLDGGQYVIMPIIDLDNASRLFMRLRYRLAPGGTALLVGIMSNPYDASSFTTLHTLTATASAYSTVDLSMSGYTDSGLYVAFHAVGNNPSSAVIDNIELQIIPFVDYRLTAWDSVQIVPTTTPEYNHRCYIWLGDSAIAIDSLPCNIGGLPADSELQLGISADSSIAHCSDPFVLNTSHPAPTPLCGLEASLSIYSPVWRGPQLEDSDISSLRLRAYVTSASAGTRIAVGTMRWRNTDSTFHAVDTIVCGSTGYVTATLSNYQGNGRFLALQLLEGDAVLSDITIDHCLTPLDATVSLVRHNIVRLQATGATFPLWLRFGPTGGQQNTIRIESLPVDFTLENSTTYSFLLACDSIDTPSATCADPLTITTLDTPPALSWCATFDNTGTSLPDDWRMATNQNAAQMTEVTTSQSHSATRSLHMYSTIGHTTVVMLPDMGLDTLNGLALSLWLRCSGITTSALEVGVIFNTSDPETFSPLARLTCDADGVWERKLIDLGNAPDGAWFLALRCRGVSGTNNIWVDDLHIAECGAHGLEVTNVEANQITLRWRQTGSPDITLRVIPEDDTPYDVSVPQTSLCGYRSLTISSLTALTNYRFALTATCDSATNHCTTNYTDTCRVFTPAGGRGCIDPTNLTAAYTTCFYGTYGDPVADTGSIDYGYSSPLSRHTIHYDANERDPRTQNLLPTIPEGATASVRLGNWSHNSSAPEAEAISYGIAVDTLDFNLLIMRYAAVLQDPNHSRDKQPRFSLELLDATGRVLDSTCGRADFIANYQMGWNVAPNNVLWKDWTTVGVDLTPYAGQTVYVRLTTRDCNEGSHYGYAYFTLECMRKNITTSRCGIVDDNQLTAPAGFNYYWYTSLSADTLSTSQTIVVPTDNTLSYLCQVSFVDNPTCNFTMSAFAGTRYPLSLFDYQVTLAECSFDVSFTNRSTISSDGITPVGTGEGVESSLWILGNGDTIDDYNTFANYPEGNYNVSLITGIAGDACLDTLTVPLNLVLPPTGMRLEGPVERCWNQPTDTIWLHNVVSLVSSNSQWTLDDSTVVGTKTQKRFYLLVDSLSYAPGTYTFNVTALDSVGCTKSLTHTLTVHYSYRQYDTLHLCSLLLPYSWRDTTITTADLTPPSSVSDHTIHRYSIHSCDSVMKLHLTLYNNADFTPRDTAYGTICDNQQYYFSDSLLTPNATLSHNIGSTTLYYTDSLFSSIGCDSLSTIVLTVRPTYDHHLSDTVCANHSYTWGTPQRQMLPPDSIVVNVHATDTLTATPHSSLLTPNYPYDTTFTDNLSTVNGCDSLSSLHLHVPPAYDLHYYDTICNAHLLSFGDDSLANWQHHTYPFIGSSFDSTGTYRFSLSTSHFTCDSTRSLHLKVYPTYDLHYYDTIYDGDRYTFEATVYDTTGVYPHTLAATYACDSLRTIHLQRWPRTYIDTVLCQNRLPYTWNAVTFANGEGLHTQGGMQVLQDSVHLTNHYGGDSLVVMTVVVRDTSYTVDYVHSCDSLIWPHTPDTTYRQTTAEPYRYLTQTTPFDTNDLHNYFRGGDYLPFTVHLAPFSVQCDSVRHLDLTVDYTHYSTDYLMACDSMLWPSNPQSLTASHWFYRDTLGTAGRLGSFQVTGPVDTLVTVGGCDSVVNLDLKIHYATYHCDIDTFCWHQIYHWRTQQAGDTLSDHWPVTDHYYLTDTLQTHLFRHPSNPAVMLTCDSVRAIQLTQMARPQLTLTDSADCARELYVIGIETDVPYSRWTDNRTSLSAVNQLSIDVSPQQNTVYRAYVDYHATPLCPLTDSLALRPMAIPEAVLKVNPEALSYDALQLDAYDLSTVVPNSIHPDDPDQWVRTWFVDWMRQDETDWQFHYEALPDEDTLRLALSVFNGQCTDTALRLLPINRVALFAPNVFTPLRDNNREFIIVGHGIYSAELYIYNREGLLIYRGSATSPDGNIELTWDGRRTDGAMCLQANYVWKLVYRAADRTDRTEVGNVLLLK